MPGFRVHITGSSIVGVGYAAAAWYVGDMPPMTCVLAGGLCSVAGTARQHGPKAGKAGFPRRHEHGTDAVAGEPRVGVAGVVQEGVPLFQQPAPQFAR